MIWISVEDRYPIGGERVLSANRFGFIDIVIYYKDYSWSGKNVNFRHE